MDNAPVLPHHLCYAKALSCPAPSFLVLHPRNLALDGANLASHNRVPPGTLSQPFGTGLLLVQVQLPPQQLLAPAQPGAIVGQASGIRAQRTLDGGSVEGVSGLQDGEAERGVEAGGDGGGGDCWP